MKPSNSYLNEMLLTSASVGVATMVCAKKVRRTVIANDVKRAMILIRLRKGQIGETEELLWKLNCVDKLRVMSKVFVD
jgi:hypothetical protein